MKENLPEIISELSKEKGIDRETVIRCLEEAVAVAAQKKLPKYRTVEAHYNHKVGQIELFQYRMVSPSVTDSDNEVSLEEALEMDPNAEEGDEVEYEIDSREFSSIAQSARQSIFQKIREAERQVVYDTFKDRKGEILTGVVVRTEADGRVAITFNRVEAYLFRQEQIPGERFSHGDHVRVFLVDVSSDIRKASQLVISRSHPGLLIKLFEMEVPEIYDETIEVVNAAREPGKRAKIAVYTSDDDLDPVGACVGVRGSRVQAIVSELKGEKIDIVRWSEDLEAYVRNALAPAEILRMQIQEERREITVWAAASQLSLAIGRQGQNVRLASKLVGFNINILPIEEKQTLSIEAQLALELEKAEERQQEAQQAQANAIQAASLGNVKEDVLSVEE